MSEGQQQRIAVVRTIVMRPLLILEDEPTGGVNPETGETIISSLLTLVKDHNSGMLITTLGGIDSFTGIADRIYNMNGGGILPLQL